MRYHYGTFQNKIGFVWIDRLSKSDIEVIENRGSLTHLVRVHDSKQKAKAHALDILNDSKGIWNQSLKGLE